MILMFAPNTDLFLQTGILAENTQGHMDTPSSSVLSLGPFKALFWLPEDVSRTNISDSTAPQACSALRFIERAHSLGLLSSS